MTGNASITGNCSKAAPEGPHGANWLCEGVAVFRDPIDSRLFLLGSHLTGWEANSAMLYVSDRQEVCGSEWIFLGNPGVGPGAASTFGAQSTFVLPFRSSCNQTTMVMMADAWHYPNESLASYVWLPLRRSDTGNWTVQWTDEWTLPECRDSDRESRLAETII